MKKKLALISFFLPFCFNQVYAAQPPQPQKCPSAIAIRAIGVSRNVIESNNLWYTGRRHQNYDTTNAWTFVLGNIVATGTNDAFIKATVGLNSLSFPTGPLAGPLDKWLCLYSTQEGYTGVAITTPLALRAAKQFLVR